jgi:PAS domain S-box-containing protein
MKNSPNLLIVDDAEDNLLFLESVIKKFNANIICALSGQEALQKTEGIPLALAIIDVRMPIMNGYEVAVELNKKRPDNKVPIIFLTASHSSEAQQFKGYSSGAVDYLFKPFDIQILNSKIAVFLDPYNQKQIIIRNTAQLKKNAEELNRANIAIKNSEALYRSYIDNAPDAIFIVEGKGKFLEVNNAATRITGYSKEKLLTMSLSDILTGASNGHNIRYIRSLVQTGSTELDIPYKHQKGSIRWWSLEVVRHSQNRYLCFANDITDRKQAEAETQQTRNNYETFFNTIHDFLFVLDEGGNIIHTNNTVTSRLQYSKEELIGNSLLMLHSSDQHDEARENIADMLAGLKDYCDIPIYTKSGEQIPVESRLTKGSWNGKPAIFGVSKDISQIKFSEEKFSKVFYVNPSACGLDDLETGAYIEVNNAFHDLLGFTKDEVIGKTALELGIISREAMNEVLAKAVGRKSVRGVETSLKAKNGEIKQVLLSTESIVLQNKTYRYTVVHDISERVLAENTLKFSESKYKTLLDSSPDGVFLISLDQIITEVSEIGVELLGAQSREELIGKSISQFILPDDSNSIREIINKTLTEGLIQNVEIAVQKKNQSVFLCEISATLIQSAVGMPFSFLFTVRDISQRKKKEAKQIHADRMANLGEMASGIAHEINQPLNIISMVMDKLLFESEKNNQVDLDLLKVKSEKIFENITRIKNIIDNIRAFSRSHEDYLLTDFDLNKSIVNATSMITEQFKHLGIKLNLHLDKQLPLICGNTYKFEQVIINLLSNAKDAVIDKKNHEGEAFNMVVGIKSYQDNQMLIVEVTDNGMGIGKDDVNNILLPFYTTKDEGKGTGLGLSICYQIMKEMDGTISIESERPGGTTIRLMLTRKEKK